MVGLLVLFWVLFTQVGAEWVSVGVLPVRR